MKAYPPLDHHFQETNEATKKEWAKKKKKKIGKQRGSSRKGKGS